MRDVSRKGGMEGGIGIRDIRGRESRITTFREFRHYFGVNIRKYFIQIKSNLNSRNTRFVGRNYNCSAIADTIYSLRKNSLKSEKN